MQRSLLSYLRRLRNHEFAEAYQLICNNLYIEELEASNVAQAVKAVLDYANKIGLLKNLKRKHVNTQKLDALKKERHQYLLSLRGRVAYCMKSPAKEEREAAKILHTWMLAYHEFFSGATIHPQSRLVSNMRGELNEVEELSTALSALNLVHTVNSIAIITSDMRHLHLTRLKENKEASAQAKHIRETAFAHIVTLWKTLEVATALKTHDGELCRTLFESINWVIIDFKARYLDKTTRRENERLKDQENKNTPLDPAEV